jgi:Calponin homology (CH) domain
MSGRDLLVWAQRAMAAGGLEEARSPRSFGDAKWGDGLAFAALADGLDKQLPDLTKKIGGGGRRGGGGTGRLLGDKALLEAGPEAVLEAAFEHLRRSWGVDKLLDAEDVVEFQERFSIQTYLIEVHKAFARRERTFEEVILPSEAEGLARAPSSPSSTTQALAERSQVPSARPSTPEKKSRNEPEIATTARSSLAALTLLGDRVLQLCFAVLLLMAVFGEPF